MKKTITFFLLYQFVLQTAFSQNVGIGTTTPQSKLDINGDIALQSADLTISTTYTYALNVNTVKQSNYKLKQPGVPIGNFILAGITAGVEGRLITLTNRTPSSMEIYNEDVNATAANRIQTGTGSTIAIYPNGNVTLQYDATDQRWSIKSMHNNSLDYFGGNGGSSYWDLAGQNISNTNTGNVGIGTAVPFYKLDITGEERINGSAITSPGFNGGLTSGGSLRIENSSNNFFLKTDGSKIQAEKSNLQTTGSTASTLSINPHGGNVGIGIDGDIPYKLSIYQPVIESNSNTSVLQLRGQNPVVNFADQFNTSRGYIKGVTNNSQTQYPGVGIAIGASDLQDGFGNFGDIYLLGRGYQPAITIKGTTNNVGIGTNSPTEKLSVNGHIRAKEIVVETGWADYVFEKAYKLIPLPEVETFIQQNNHLPNIPSAAEIQSNGLKVGEVQTKMMEKIEELTLYIIEMQKEIELLKKK